MELHLLKHPSLNETEIGFSVSGSNTVEKVRYNEENGRVYFNKEQYFEGVSKVVWEYQNYTMIYVRITKEHIV